MSYKIGSQGIYTIDIENALGEITQISIDATDVKQIDELLSLYDVFEEVRLNLKKRIEKLKKEYSEENIILKQSVRVTREELSKINDALNKVFGNEFSEKAFLGSLSVSSYVQFFKMLEKEFGPAIKKGQQSISDLIEKYDSKDGDDVL